MQCVTVYRDPNRCAGWPANRGMWALDGGGGNHDLGYPRVVQRPDGAIVTAYDFSDRADGERYIGVTIWKGVLNA